MSEPMSWDEFATRVSNGVLDRAFLAALENNIILDPSDPGTRQFAGFIVGMTLIHLGDLGQQFQADQLAEAYIMRVTHFMQEADQSPPEGGT